MGLFSRHKKKEDAGKNAPSSDDKKSSDSNTAPPVPEMNSQSSMPELESSGKLSPPPTPHAAFDDIKAQVSTPAEMPVESTEQTPTKDEKPNSFDFGDDSLFDIPEVDLKPDVAPAGLPTTKQAASTAAPTSTQLSVHSSSELAMPAEMKSGQPFYITTQQFKEVLGIVENVKGKVKQASETHLRLLDIKSEEDIEYDNLRKEFQYIEDQLYELDHTIFEK